MVDLFPHVSLLVGLVGGYLLGIRRGESVIKAYKDGLKDQKELSGPCWVKAQVDARTKEYKCE